MIRSTLGTVLGALLRAYEQLTTEPNLRRLARELGWSFDDIRRELRVRGVSHKWQYESGIGAFLSDEDDAPESRIIKDRDGGFFVVWHGQACTPHFNSMGAAEAYRDMLRRGQRSPEYPS